MDASKFNKIIGNNKIKNSIISDLNNNNISHAYLLNGPSGVGKFLTAKIFSEILQEDSSSYINDTIIINELPLEKVENSKKTTSINLKTRKTDTISVDDISHINHSLSQSTLSNFKIVIIRKVERMNRSALNKLLKTLEEPPSPSTIFILTTDKIEILKKTLISRCRILNFSTVEAEDIKEGIKRLGFNVNAIEKLLEILPGEPGKIINLLENDDQLELHKHTWDSLRRLLNKKNNIVDRFNFIEEIHKSKEKTKAFLDTVHYFLYYQYRNSIKSKEQVNKIEKQLDFLNLSIQSMKLNVNTRLVLENIMLVV